MQTTNEPYSESLLPLLQKYYSLETIAQEPWNDDCTLYVPNKSQILIDNGGADSYASIIYLSLLNLKFKIKSVKNVNEMSPSGRSPLLKCGRYTVGEFEPIVNFCNLKGFRLLADYLDTSKKTQIKTYILLIQKTYSDTITYILWKDPENQKTLKNTFRKNYPWPLSDILYLNEYLFVKNKLSSINLWSCDKQQVLGRFVEVNDSLNRKLDGSLNLVGNSLTEVDILLYSYLKVINMNQEFDSILNCLVNLKNISDFYSCLNKNFEKLLNDQMSP